MPVRKNRDHAILTGEGLISPNHLPPQISAQSERTALPSAPDDRQPKIDDGENITYFNIAREDPEEKKALIAALRQSNGNPSQAARILGINRVTVWNRLKNSESI